MWFYAKLAKLCLTTTCRSEGPETHRENAAEGEQGTPPVTVASNCDFFLFFFSAVRITVDFMLPTSGELLIVSHFHFYIENVDCKIYYIIRGV